MIFYSDKPLQAIKMLFYICKTLKVALKVGIQFWISMKIILLVSVCGSLIALVRFFGHKVYHPLGIICMTLNAMDFAAPLAGIVCNLLFINVRVSTIKSQIVEGRDSPPCNFNTAFTIMHCELIGLYGMVSIWPFGQRFLPHSMPEHDII